MNRKSFVRIAFGVVASLSFAGSLAAAEAKSTVISIPGMHCDGCAKKVVTKVLEVGGVESASSSMETKTVKVTPNAGMSLSPKALWEAVEKAKKTPTKLVGPSGTFSSKPSK